MILYYSPITGQSLSQADLWKLYLPLKDKYKFTEFRRILGYEKMDVDMMQKRIQAQNAFIGLLLKRLKLLLIRINVQDLVKDHEYSRKKRRL